MAAASRPVVRRFRIGALGLVLAWVFLPPLRRLIPLWVPFLAVVALELQFLIAGLRERGSFPARRGRRPQETDIAELGGEEWLEPVLLEVDGREVWLPAGGEADDESSTSVAGRRDPVARPRRLLARLEGLAVVAVLGLALFVPLRDDGWSGLEAAERAEAESLFSLEAEMIAGHPVRVRCDAEGERVGIVQHADGVAEVGGVNAFLTPDICFRLFRLAFEGDEGPFSQTARAIAVLAHEAWHLRGVRDEGITNCYAFQSGVVLGRRLGLSEKTAARMMRQQLSENATFARSAPAYVVSGECRDGGRLDRSPGSSRFP